MAPLIQDTDILSSSSHDDYFGKSVTFAPLHEGPIVIPHGVHFDDMATVYDVICLDDYTPEELSDAWYDRDDMIRMKEAARSDAKLLDSGMLPKKGGITFRGLEHRTREGAKRKRQHRMNAWGAVFCEIDFQKEDEMIDEETIADAYFMYSEKCAEAAYEVAKRDALDAMNIYFKSKKAKLFWKKHLKNDF